MKSPIKYKSTDDIPSRRPADTRSLPGFSLLMISIKQRKNQANISHTLRTSSGNLEGHTNMGECSLFLVFVCPLPITWHLMFDVRYTQRNVTITLVPLLSRLATLLLNSARVTLNHYPCPLFPRYAHKLIHGSGKWMDFLVVSVGLMRIHYFHTLAIVSATQERHREGRTPR